ncbi:O-acyltransferase like protein-like [Chrysoperla carnea]|uniref:O-acyltransferase like protein-like n=1 Tax=Chrysoperla carnea TaxID=189513 RepID=UPI001D08D3B2|nr:O-acyltransferase like protein-like [Chrysoperla carnea]
MYVLRISSEIIENQSDNNAYEIIQNSSRTVLKNGKSIKDIYKSLQEFNLYSWDVQDNIKSINISTDCMMDYLNVIQSLDQQWALQMIDASAKGLPPSILEGSVFNLGNYEECLSIENTVETIVGQYCIAQTSIIFTANNKLPIFNGICVPHRCSAKDISKIIDFILKKSVLPTSTNVMLCSTNEMYNFRKSDWITISITSVIILWIFICTILDVWMPHLTTNCYIFRAFSLYYNGSKLFKISTSTANSKTITCLNGMRVISILWIILDHRYVLTFMFPFNINNMETKKYLTSLQSTYVTGGTVSVDTFFIMSGFLLTLTFLKQIDRLKGKFPWIMFYVHRYIRLTVGLLVVLIFTLTIAIKIGRGPFWNVLVQNGLVELCEKKWWSALLYVQNYANSDSVCLGHTWYLAVDMQLYVLSPLILYPMWRWKKFTYIVIPILLVILHISTYLIVFLLELKVKYMTTDADQQDIADYNKYYYQPSHTRAIPWLMGVLLGYYIYHLQVPKRLNKIFVFLMWIVSLVLLVAVVMTVYPFVQDDSDPDSGWEPIYIVFSRTFWSIGICWIIFACYTGYGGPINWFLSLNMWTPLCRISYSVYLIHLIQQLMKEASTHTIKYFSPFETFFETFGDVVLTCSLATCMYLCFESPIFNLETWLLKRASSSNREQSQGTINAGLTSSTQALTA